MASQDENGVDRFTQQEIVRIRGDYYAFGINLDMGGSAAFVPFRVENNKTELFPLTWDVGFSLTLEVSDVKTLQELIDRVRSQFIPMLQRWLSRKYPGALTPTSTNTSSTPLLDMGDKVAGMIKITEGPNGPVASME